MKHVLIILIFFLGMSAQADVLFVDLNNSPTEVEAAERAAEARGERLIVFPELSDETLHQIKAARAMVTGAQLIERKKCRDSMSDSCAEAKLRGRAKIKSQTFSTIFIAA